MKPNANFAHYITMVPLTDSMQSFSPRCLYPHSLICIRDLISGKVYLLMSRVIIYVDLQQLVTYTDLRMITIVMKILASSLKNFLR